MSPCRGHRRRRSLSHERLLRDITVRLHSPEQTLAFPRLLLWNKLHDGGQGRRVDGHTGSCAEQRAREDEGGEGGGVRMPIPCRPGLSCKGRFRHAVRVALEKRQLAVAVGDATGEVCAWKLFLLLPFMLLRRPVGEGRVGKEELSTRFDKFSEGQWGGEGPPHKRSSQVNRE